MPSKPALPDPHAETVTYHGNCHCARVRFTLTVPSLLERKVTRCNCVLCTKHGMLMTHCLRKDFEITHGFEHCAKYINGTGMRPLRFCATCGGPIAFDVVDPEAEGAREQHVGVVVNNIEGLDFDKLDIAVFDGKARGEPYVVPPLRSHEKEP